MYRNETGQNPSKGEKGTHEYTIVKLTYRIIFFKNKKMYFLFFIILWSVWSHFRFVFLFHIFSLATCFLISLDVHIIRLNVWLLNISYYREFNELMNSYHVQMFTVSVFIRSSKNFIVNFNQIYSIFNLF